MRIGCLALVILCGLTSGATVLAGDFEDGFAALQRGEYETALRLLRPLAEQGNAKAQVNLGLMYAKGDGVPVDYAEAVGWFRRSAEQGNPKAQYCLAIALARGDGVAQDIAIAIDLLYKAGTGYLNEGERDSASAVLHKLESLSSEDPLTEKLRKAISSDAQ